MIWLLYGCAGGSAETDTACEVRGWADFGDTFLRDWCRSCHSADSPNRYGAPEGMDFDTLEDVHTWEGPIRSSVIEDESMPLGGGISDAERAEFGAWLDCGAPA